MTATPADSRFDELDTLLACLFDPGLDPAQTSRIQTLLAGNRLLQDRYADYVMMHSALLWRGGLVGFRGDSTGNDSNATLDGIVYRESDSASSASGEESCRPPLPANMPP